MKRVGSGQIFEAKWKPFSKHQESGKLSDSSLKELSVDFVTRKPIVELEIIE